MRQSDFTLHAEWLGFTAALDLEEAFLYDRDQQEADVDRDGHRAWPVDLTMPVSHAHLRVAFCNREGLISEIERDETIDALERGLAVAAIKVLPELADMRDALDRRDPAFTSRRQMLARLIAIAEAVAHFKRGRRAA